MPSLVANAFLVGDSEKVLTRRQPFVLDPLRRHPVCLKRLDKPGAPGTSKQLARLGEAFVVSERVVALSVVRLPGASSERCDDCPAP